MTAPVEYNTWYSSDGVLYDTTQTGLSTPVLISLPSSGNASVGMVVTYESTVPCDKIPVMQPLIIDDKQISYTYSCTPLENNYFVSYSVTDPGTVGYVLSKLRSDFTVVLMRDIKIWASNINQPVYGKGNWIRN